ncbi:maleylacetate reductase [Chromobacterium sp. ATCC 53434]|uniref:maleylacetate reductase n=1 Tax=Chromobacterium sp. (strain ATCC 53434 / SC 14030) TaxID=2059672 RepID=UPI000C775CEA|nr:maleylacetate reductase [Chromobacterium sp. ATCC 53434]AUH50282.1 maleylacetate reductase [Chromobacterium sp. ATCC 53434]
MQHSTAHPFIYTAVPTRVIFGAGTRTGVADEAARLGMSRVLLVHGPAHQAEADRLAARLGHLFAGAYPRAAMHTPTSVTDEALALARECRADGIVAIGGGSATGLSKAIALRTDLPQIVLPTTYAGSEMSNILGETRNGLKTTLRDAAVQPETVIYDVELTLDLPAGMSGASGMNALAHAVEALYARDGNPIVSLIAEEGIRALYRALPRLGNDKRALKSRADALYGAWLCGLCLGSVAMALHHRLCHVIGGTFDLPHAETHAILLPHVLAYNAPAIAPVWSRLRKALRADDPALAFHRLGLATSDGHYRYSLEGIGMPADGIDHAVDLALAQPCWNPRAPKRAPLRALLRRAFGGKPPSSAD